MLTILLIAFFGVVGFALDTTRQLVRADRARVALEIELAQVTEHRDRLAEVLAHYEAPLTMNDIRWVMGTRGLVLLTLN